MSQVALVHFDAAKAALQKAASVDECKRIRDQAQAMQAYVRQARGSLVMQNQCAEIKLRAERKLGGMLDKSVLHHGGRPQKQSQNGTVSASALLKSLGINKNQSSRWQRIAQIPERKFESHLKAVRENGDEELTTAGLVRACVRQNTVDAMTSSETYEWYTPAKYVDAAREVMGDIDLDPAASKASNKVVRAKTFFAVEEDGLTYHWHGNVWLNPPYGLSVQHESNQGLWSKALIGEYRSHRVKQAILLVTASTDTAWFQPLWDYPICFVSHRIQFDTPQGKGPQPTHGNAFVYFGSKTKAFAQGFRKFGRIVVPYGRFSQVQPGRKLS